jgi:hypothetical protein
MWSSSRLSQRLGRRRARDVCVDEREAGEHQLNGLPRVSSFGEETIDVESPAALVGGRDDRPEHILQRDVVESGDRTVEEVGGPFATVTRYPITVVKGILGLHGNPVYDGNCAAHKRQRV